MIVQPNRLHKISIESVVSISHSWCICSSFHFLSWRGLLALGFLAQAVWTDEIITYDTLSILGVLPGKLVVLCDDGRTASRSHIPLISQLVILKSIFGSNHYPANNEFFDQSHSSKHGILMFRRG